MTHQTIRILQCIQKEEKPTNDKISKTVKIAHNTASEHVKRLILKGYVRKIRDSLDERKVRLTLTTDGKEVLYKNTCLDEHKLQ